MNSSEEQTAPTRPPTIDSRASTLPSWAIIVALLALCAISRLALFSSTLGNDDLRHAFAAYFLVSSDAEKHAVVKWSDDVPYRRMGINLPLWLSMRVFGVSDASMALAPLAGSLLGVASVFFLLRHMSGLPAAVLAGGIYAALPEDVYMGTLWLQDTIFVGVLSLHIYLLVRAIDSHGGRRLAWAMAAGLALGYLQFTKETTFLLLAITGIWSLVALRRKEPGAMSLFVLVLLGFVAVQFAMAAVFWPRHPELLFYWRETLSFMWDKAQNSPPLPVILELLWKRTTHYWLFGYLIVAFPITATIALVSRRTKHRLVWAMLLLTQAGVLYGAMRMTQGQNRYLLQLALPFVILTSIGLWRIVEWLKINHRPSWTFLFILAAIGATASAIRPERQQYGMDRTYGLRSCYQYLRSNAGRDPIFAAGSDAGSYTFRTLYQFNGFQDFRGGLFDLSRSLGADRGLVVLSDLEKYWLGRTPPPTPPNWEQVFSVDGRVRWARVYRLTGRAELPDGEVELLNLSQHEDLQFRLSGDGAAREPIRTESGSLEFELKSDAPAWLFVEKRQSFLRMCPGVWTDGRHPRLTLIAQARSSKPVSAGIGIKNEAAAQSDMIGSARIDYAPPVELGPDPRELTCVVSFPPGTYAYAVPVVRVEGSAGTSVIVEALRLVASPADE